MTAPSKNLTAESYRSFDGTIYKKKRDAVSGKRKYTLSVLPTFTSSDLTTIDPTAKKLASGFGGKVWEVASNTANFLTLAKAHTKVVDAGLQLKVPIEANFKHLPNKHPMRNHIHSNPDALGFPVGDTWKQAFEQFTVPNAANIRSRSAMWWRQCVDADNNNVQGVSGDGQTVALIDSGAPTQWLWKTAIAHSGPVCQCPDMTARTPYSLITGSYVMPYVNDTFAFAGEHLDIEIDNHQAAVVSFGAHGHAVDLPVVISDKRRECYKLITFDAQGVYRFAEKIQYFIGALAQDGSQAYEWGVDYELSMDGDVDVITRLPGGVIPEEGSIYVDTTITEQVADLPGRNVTNVVVRSAANGGGTLYVAGRDYTIILSTSYEASPGVSANTNRLKWTYGGTIPFGSTVYVTYDYEWNLHGVAKYINDSLASVGGFCDVLEERADLTGYDHGKVSFVEGVFYDSNSTVTGWTQTANPEVPIYNFFYPRKHAILIIGSQSNLAPISGAARHHGARVQVRGSTVTGHPQFNALKKRLLLDQKDSGVNNDLVQGFYDEIEWGSPVVAGDFRYMTPSVHPYFKNDRKLFTVDGSERRLWSTVGDYQETLAMEGVWHYLDGKNDFQSSVPGFDHVVDFFRTPASQGGYGPGITTPSVGSNRTFVFNAATLALGYRGVALNEASSAGWECAYPVGVDPWFSRITAVGIREGDTLVIPVQDGVTSEHRLTLTNVEYSGYNHPVRATIDQDWPAELVNKELRWSIVLSDPLLPYYDFEGHGTTMAGLISGDQSAGYAGVASQAALMILKGRAGAGNIDSLVAIMNSKPVAVSCSFGYAMSVDQATNDPFLNYLVYVWGAVAAYLSTVGTLVFASSGNDGIDYDGATDYFQFPAGIQGLQGVVNCGPVGFALNPAVRFNTPANPSNPSSTGFDTFAGGNVGQNLVAFMAPGMDGHATIQYRLYNAARVAELFSDGVTGVNFTLPSTISNSRADSLNLEGGIRQCGGTSMSCPIVAATAALVAQAASGKKYKKAWEQKPGIDRYSLILSAMMQGADAEVTNAQPYSKYEGAGRLNVSKAIQVARLLAK